jgi:hypothetical protein
LGQLAIALSTENRSRALETGNAFKFNQELNTTLAFWPPEMFQGAPRGIASRPLSFFGYRGISFEAIARLHQVATLKTRRLP